MSGHSKWSTIKRQKGLNDKKRGATFTKLSNAITLAVKQGGGIGDPEQNFRLRLAMDSARSANMPKENVQRAIKRAQGKDMGDIAEIIYEGFAPGGVSVIIEAATDNTMRTTSDVKSIFHKAGGSFGQPGSVAYQFKQVGRIIIDKGIKSFDDIFTIAVEAQAEDIEEVGSEIYIFTSVADFAKVRQSLLSADLKIVEASLVREPVITTEISDQDLLTRVENFVNTLEDLDDIQKVYTNLL